MVVGAVAVMLLMAGLVLVTAEAVRVTEFLHVQHKCEVGDSQVHAA